MAKILLIDNDEELNQKNTELFRKNGHEVFLCNSATAGLKKALEITPDLIISEVHLEKDTAGFEMLYLLRSKRKDSKYLTISHTPVIILTKIHQETKFRFSYSDDDSYLPQVHEIFSKPIDNETLIAAVDKILS